MKKSTQMACRKLLLFIGMLWIMALSSFAQMNSYVHSDKSVHVPPTRSGLVIYDQFNEISWGGITSQELSDMPTYTCNAADDFIVPAGAEWNIRYIDVAGFFSENYTATVSAVNVFIYADDNGKPGNILNSFSSLTTVVQVPIDTVIHKLEIALPSAIVLAEGHYWLGVQAVGDFSAISFWRWSSHVGMTINNEFYFKNPLDGFGTGMIDWTSGLLIAWSDFDLAFKFYGQGLPNDLSMLSIAEPATGPGLSATEPVSVLLKNEGTNTQTGFNVSFTIDGGTAVSENVGAFTLAPNQNALYTFTATADLSVPGAHLIDAAVNLAADTMLTNNSLSKSVYNLGTIYPMPATGTSTITTCGATMTDSGGLNGDFGMNDNATTTIYPATSGDRIKLTFLTFDASFGGFSIYDGVDMNAPLIGTWFGTDGPVEIVALNATGALTVHFESSGWETRPGWSAYISCYTPVPDDFAALALTCNIPTLFTGDKAVLSVKVQNYGSLSQSKMVTFKANNAIIGTLYTPLLNPADTAWVSMNFIPLTAGSYSLVACLPTDSGTQPNDTIALEKTVYQFGTFYEDFEGSAFPPENWRHHGSWSRAGYFPAVGSFNAECFVDYTASDTLVSPRLDIHQGDMLSFAAKTTPWWVGNLDLYYLNEQTGMWHFMQNIPLTSFGYTWHTIDMSVAAGINRIGFFVNVTDPNSFSGAVMVDNVMGQGIIVHRDDHDLKAKAFTGNSFYNVNEPASFQLVVRNDGLTAVSSSSYTVKLMKNGANPVELLSVPGLALAAQQETTFNLTNTFPAIDTLSVFAKIEYAEDQYPVNNQSSTIALTGLAGNSVVVPVGNDLFQVNWPIDFSYKKSLSETIYLNSEINQTGVVFGINYDYSFAAPETNVPVRIWVGETTLNEIVDWVPATEMTLVYDGQLNYQAGKHSIYIPFQTPFNYSDGSKNVVIMTEKIEDHYEINQNFYAYPSATNSSIEMSGDEVIPDPNAPSGGWATGINPNIKFVFNNTTGSLQGTVTASGGSGMTGVLVKIDELGISTTTNGSGNYLMPLVPAGSYQVTANKFEYLPVTKPAIVSTNATTVDFVLSLLDLLTVSGRVVGNNDPSTGLAFTTVSLSGYSNFTAVTNAEGYFTIQNVYSNNTYALLVSNQSYETYTNQVILVNSAVDLGVITLIEKLVIPYAITAVDQINKTGLTWYTPDITAAEILSFDDSVNSNGYAGEPNEEVWLGNYFPFEDKSTVTSFDIYWAGYGVNTPQTMRLDIFDEQANLLASSSEFTSGIDKWINVDVPNLTLQGNYYVMIHWSGTFAQSTYLGFDTASATTPDFAYYLYPGGMPQPLSGLTGEFGTFLIHANAMVGAKKSTLAPGSVTAVSGFNVYRGLLSDINNAANWPKINANSSLSTGYEDLTWPPDVDGYYVYAIEALYNQGESELAFSNVLLSLYSGVEQLTKPQYSVYPNPASEYLNLLNCKDTKVTLFSMDGKLILNTEIHDNNYRLNVAGISKGVYSLLILGKSDLLQLKIVIN